MKRRSTTPSPAAPPLDPDALASAIAARLADEIADRLRLDTLAGDDTILSPAEAARLLGRSAKSLESWRSLGTGPTTVQIGLRGVGYRLGDLRLYIRSRPALGRRVIEATLPAAVAAE